MGQVTLTVEKDKVYAEIAKTTSYTGQKMVGDETAYQRIFTTDEDKDMLSRFWNEACSGATDLLKPFINTIDVTSDYCVTLDLSCRYDNTLTGSVQTSLFSYFVYFILSRWYKMANKGEYESYAVDAASMLEDVMHKIYHRTKPQRITP